MTVQQVRGAKVRRTALLVIAAAVSAMMLMGTMPLAAASVRPICGGKVATIVGSARSELIVGTSRDDVIAAGGGNDVVRGGGGNDRICGEAGADRLMGQGGNDRLFGNAGPDRLYGHDGSDRLYGNAGNDRLEGGRGGDSLDGGTQTDTCFQNPGRGPRRNCERPGPKVLVIGGIGSGQLAGPFWAVVGSGVGPFNISSGVCATGQVNYGASGTEEYRFALEFPLTGLPAGAAIVEAKLSVRAMFAAPLQNLYGYVANGSISTADATPSGTAITFDAPAPGYQTVDVSSLVTPAMASAGWAGFLQAREGLAGGQRWDCRATDADYPKLTIRYKIP
jgi:hypothetical protein